MQDGDPHQQLTHAEALKALAWLVDMGAAEATTPDPINRFEAETTPGAPPSKAPANQAHADSAAARPAARTIQPKPPQNPVGAGASAAQSVAEAATSLQDLKDRMAAFDGGHLKRAAKNLVFADGQEDADIMFVGEAPGAEEDQRGLPFVGRAGQLLDRMLASAAFDRSKNAYITNLVPWRPIGNKTPDAAMVAMCLPFLKKHIALQAPKIVVCLGASPSRALFDTDTGISRLRGKWQTLEFYGHSCHVLATYHPAYLLRQPRFKGDAWRDLLSAKDRLAEA